MVIGDELGSGFAFGGLAGVTTAFAAKDEVATDCCTGGIAGRVMPFQ